MSLSISSDREYKDRFKFHVVLVKLYRQLKDAVGIF